MKTTNKNTYELVFLKGFRKAFERLSDIHRKMVMDTVLLLKNDPYYQSLRTKRMGGKYRNYESSVNMDIRILWRFRDDGNSISLIDVGHHDVLKKY